MAGDTSGSIYQSIKELFTEGTVAGFSDGQLLGQFSTHSGDTGRQAFAALVKRHGPMVFRVCRDVLRNVHDAEDAFQATFFILARKARSIRRPDSLAPWLYGVAYHVAITARAVAVRRRAHELKASASTPQTAAQRDWDDLVPAIHEELSRLPERYRAAVVLCCVEGLTQQQAAQRLGLPLGTLQSRLARGREQLRARLTRRGLALTTALAARTAQAAVPAALENVTVRLAAVSAGVCVLTTGTIPVAVSTLAREAMKAMSLSKLKCTGLAVALATVLVAAGAAAHAYQGSRSAPAEAGQPATPPAASSSPGRLTVTGTVLMPDGSPAAGAIVTSASASNDPAIVVHADDAGRFRVDSVFGNGASFHARSADGGHQALLDVPAVAARASLASPLRLTLARALNRWVTVVSGDRPVIGAHVLALGRTFKIHGVTGPDGRVSLQLPPEGRLYFLAAWHPDLGADGAEGRGDRPPQDPWRLALRASSPHTVRVLDSNGKPIGGLELGINVRTEDSAWIVAQDIREAHVRTNDDGIATVRWMPAKKLQAVEVKIIGSDWQIDETDRRQVGTGTTAVHARRLHTVEGRLVMPDGVSAEGILVSGYGFGPKDHGISPSARAQRDGTFALRIPADYAFVLGIDDIQWAADPWSGTILGKDTKPAKITMDVYPATPLAIHVTRGPKRDPVANAWVNLSSEGKVAWTDADGKTRRGTTGVRTWLFTDASGEAKAGVGRGEYRLRLTSGDWTEERNFKVSAAKPVAVDFHRPWSGERKITGRLKFEGARYKPSQTLVARAWIPQAGTAPRPVEPVVRADGTFDVVFDAESLSLYVADPEQHRAAFVELGSKSATTDITMEATTVYSGALVDEDDRPMANRTLRLYVKEGFRQEATGEQRTDAAGRFRFVDVPVNVPLRLELGDAGHDPEYFLFEQRLFVKGDARENDRVTALRRGPSAPAARRPVPLAGSVADLCRSARAAGMHVLFVLQGDDSAGVVTARDRLLDYDRNRAVLGYLTKHLDADALAAEAATLTQLGWPRPAPGELVLIALDGDRKVLGTQRSAASGVAGTVDRGDAFLKQHGPPVRDAMSTLTQARQDAQRTGRRVWLVVGGPRCAPCFRLARWMNENHALLERDYVVVKVMDGIDANATAAIASLPIKQGDGIPWHAITEPDGTILATSVGPLGNIGFPSSVEGIRHLRLMLDRTVRKLTADDMNRLVTDLSAGP